MSPEITLRKIRRKDERPMLAATEHDEQAMLFQWMELACGQEPLLRLAFAIPNGGHRHIAVARKLKAEGVKPGVPDVCLPVARGPYHALYIEMKAGKNTTSAAQRDWHASLRAEGNAVVVCFSFDEARAAIERYLRSSEPGRDT